MAEMKTDKLGPQAPPPSTIEERLRKLEQDLSLCQTQVLNWSTKLQRTQGAIEVLNSIISERIPEGT